MSISIWNYFSTLCIYQVKRLTRVLEATARALFTNFAVFIKANLSGLNSWGLLMRKSREKIWNWWRCQMSIMRTKERCREIRGIFPTSSFFSNFRSQLTSFFTNFAANDAWHNGARVILKSKLYFFCSNNLFKDIFLCG